MVDTTEPRSRRPHQHGEGHGARTCRRRRRAAPPAARCRSTGSRRRRRRRACPRRTPGRRAASTGPRSSLATGASPDRSRRSRPSWVMLKESYYPHVDGDGRRRAGADADARTELRRRARSGRNAPRRVQVPPSVVISGAVRARRVRPARNRFGTDAVAPMECSSEIPSVDTGVDLSVLPCHSRLISVSDPPSPQCFESRAVPSRASSRCCARTLPESGRASSRS